MMMSALITAIHQGWPFAPEGEQDRRFTLHDLDEQVEVGRVLVGDARDALDEAAG